jgi:hypothetical protein
MNSEVLSRNAIFNYASGQMMILRQSRPGFSLLGVLCRRNVLEEWIIRERYSQQVVAVPFRMLNLCP